MLLKDCFFTFVSLLEPPMMIEILPVIIIVFFSDCTARVWDLSTGQSVATLTRHHSYVRKVTFCPLTQLVFTACQSLIKVWDFRNLKKPEYVRTLQ